MIGAIRTCGEGLLRTGSALLARLRPSPSAWLLGRRIGLAAGLLAWPLDAAAEYTLRPGDTIAISTFGPLNIAHQSVVDADGRATLPVIGRVSVGGLTLAEAQAEIAVAMSAEPLRLVDDNGLERWLNLQPSEVLLEVAAYAPVFVTGTVAQPGRFSYTPGMTVRQLIADAGGLGVGMLPDDPNSRQSIELAADREVAAQRVDSIMAQVNRLQDELRRLSAESGQEVALVEPAAVEEAAPEPQPVAAPEPEPEPQPLIILDDGEGVTRPRARPEDGGEPALPSEAGTQVASAEEQPQAPEAAPAESTSAPAAAPAIHTAGSNLQEVGRQLIEAGATMRQVDEAASLRLIEEMNTRLDLLRRRQIDEEALVQRDRSEVARVQDLIERGLVPATEADVAERALLMSSMQSYDTADAIARLEIELSRATATLERQPSEAAREVLLELERQLAEANVALSQLDSIDQRLALLGGPAATQSALEFEFVLHRGSGDDAVATKVDQDEALLPGDVLEVVILLPDAAQSSASLE